MVPQKRSLWIISLCGTVVLGWSWAAWAQDGNAVEGAPVETAPFAQPAPEPPFWAVALYAGSELFPPAPATGLDSRPRAAPALNAQSVEAQSLQLITDRIPSEQEKEADQPMSWFNVAPQVGYAFFPQAQMTSDGFKTTVSSRNGLVSKLHLDFGGDGVAFELAPLFGFQTGGIDNLGGGIGDFNPNPAKASFMNLGGEFAFLYTFHLGYFYPRVGIGFHGSYLFGENIKAGAQLYGRVPVGFSLYMGKGIAFVFEAAFLVGATGIVQSFRPTVAQSVLENAGIEESAAASMSADLKKVKNAGDLEAFGDKYTSEIDYLKSHKDQGGGVDPDKIMRDAATNAVANAFRVGTGIGLELTVGLRFP